MPAVRASRSCTDLTPAGSSPSTQWTGGFEEFWSESFDRLNEYVKELQREEKPDGESG